MRALTAVQVLFAVSFLAFGVAMLFFLGVTGAILLIPGIVFAAVAGVTLDESRTSTAVALTADAVLGYFAARSIYGKLSPDLKLIEINPGVQSLLQPAPFKDFIIPVIVILLVLIALVAVALDWRSVKSAKWL